MSPWVREVREDGYTYWRRLPEPRETRRQKIRRLVHTFAWWLAVTRR